MKISSRIPLQVLKVSISAIDRGPGGALRSGPGFKAGQLLRATVLGAAKDGLLQLKTEGGIITARSEVSFPAGAEVVLEVIKEGDPPSLSLAVRKMAMADLLRNLFSHTGRIGEALKLLEPFLSGSYQVDQLPGDRGAMVKEVLMLLAGAGVNEDSDSGKILMMLKSLSVFGSEAGYFHDRKQADAWQELLEGNPGILKNRAGHDNVDGLVRMGRFLESLKVFNQSASVSEPSDFFVFPCFFSASEGWGQWMFFAERKEGAAGGIAGGYCLDFFLEMSRLGEIHLSLEVGPEELIGSFLVGDKKVRDFLRANLNELRKLLHENGFARVSLNCRQCDGGLKKIMKETAEKKGRFREVSLVDIEA
ncbi:MAG: flagellar hook-length control protein FliK [Proteobacteria bacterium]|nr:flagellar hook-length control protein FliK [Pseudomonadota bacterium]MBU1737274.1 flagellar hook-length control protein FliK [Pseudomonadota bacterium]